MRVPTLVFALALIAAPLRVAAQPTPDEVARRALVEAAERARSGNDHARAVDLYERAGQIRMSPSLRQLIALEHFELGHTVDAFDAAERCVADAGADEHLNNRDRILEVCRRVVDALRGQVGRVTVRAPSPTPSGLRVLVRGEALDASRGVASRTVSPGAVTVEATAEARRDFRVELEVAPGADVEVNVELIAPPPPAAPPSATPPPVIVRVAPTAPPHPRAADPGSVIGAGLMAGAGLAFLGTATAFALASLDADADRRASCSAEQSVCAAYADDANVRLRGYAVATNVALGVGLATLTGAALWTAFGRSRGDERVARARAVVPWLLGGAALVSVGAATAFALERSGAATERDACSALSCSDAAVRANDRYDRYSIATNVSLGVGAAAVTGGVLWLVLARNGGARGALRSWRVLPAPNGLLLGGSF